MASIAPNRVVSSGIDEESEVVNVQLPPTLRKSFRRSQSGLKTSKPERAQSDRNKLAAVETREPPSFDEGGSQYSSEVKNGHSKRDEYSREQSGLKALLKKIAPSRTQSSSPAMSSLFPRAVSASFSTLDSFKVPKPHPSSQISRETPQLESGSNHTNLAAGSSPEPASPSMSPTSFSLGSLSDGESMALPLETPGTPSPLIRSSSSRDHTPPPKKGTIIPCRLGATSSDAEPAVISPPITSKPNIKKFDYRAAQLCSIQADVATDGSNMERMEQPRQESYGDINKVKAMIGMVARLWGGKEPKRPAIPFKPSKERVIEESGVDALRYKKQHTLAELDFTKQELAYLVEKSRSKCDYNFARAGGKTSGGKGDGDDINEILALRNKKEHALAELSTTRSELSSHVDSKRWKAKGVTFKDDVDDLTDSFRQAIEEITKYSIEDDDYVSDDSEEYEDEMEDCVSGEERDDLPYLVREAEVLRKRDEGGFTNLLTAEMTDIQTDFEYLKRDLSTTALVMQRAVENVFSCSLAADMMGKAEGLMMGSDKTLKTGNKQQGKVSIQE